MGEHGVEGADALQGGRPTMPIRAAATLIGGGLEGCGPSQPQSTRAASFSTAPRDRRPRAPESAHQQWGGSPHRTEHWLSVAEGNCVVERRGGEQPEANDQSIIKKMMNSIRPDALANTRGSEVKPRTEADPEREAATPRPGLRRAQ